jgi:hypothetical protein
MLGDTPLVKMILVSGFGERPHISLKCLRQSVTLPTEVGSTLQKISMSFYKAQMGNLFLLTLPMKLEIPFIYHVVQRPEKASITDTGVRGHWISLAP